jgi:hypothetical protein
MSLLTGCSAGLRAQKPPVRTNLPIVIYHPPVPQPVKLHDEKLLSCMVDGQQMVCMSMEDARAMVANKIEVGIWMDRARNLIKYYQKHPNLK